jgi:hypothetical protein
MDSLLCAVKHTSAIVSSTSCQSLGRLCLWAVDTRSRSLIRGSARVDRSRRHRLVRLFDELFGGGSDNPSASAPVTPRSASAVRLDSADYPWSSPGRNLCGKYFLARTNVAPSQTMPSGLVPVYDITGGPENPGECGTARGSAWREPPGNDHVLADELKRRARRRAIRSR